MFDCAHEVEVVAFDAAIVSLPKHCHIHCSHAAISLRLRSSNVNKITCVLVANDITGRHAVHCTGDSY